MIMFNKEYYEERKKELDADFNLLKMRGYDKLRVLLMECEADLKRLQDKYQELIKREAEAKKGIENLPVAPEEKKKK